MKTADSGSVKQLEYKTFSLIDRAFLIIPCFLIIVFSASMYGKHVLLCALIIELCLYFRVRHNSMLFFLAVAVELGVLYANLQSFFSLSIELFVIIAYLVVRLFLRDEWNNSHVRKTELQFAGICMFFGFVFSTLVFPGTFTVLKDGSLEFTDEHSFALINPLILAQPIDNRPLQGILEVSHEYTQVPIRYLEVLFRANPEHITSVATYTQLREVQTHGIHDVPTTVCTKEEITTWIESTYPYLQVKIDEYL